MSTTPAEADSSTETPFTIDEIQNHIDIQSSPAGELTQSLSGWAELRAGISNNRDWEEIDGVGPSTAESLNETDAETLPTGGPVGPAEPAEPEVDGETGSDVDDDAENTSESDEQASEEDDEGDENDAEESDESESDEQEGEAPECNLADAERDLSLVLVECVALVGQVVE